MISEQEYNKLISIARTRFPNCYEDVVHDAVLLGLSFNESIQRLKVLSFNYFTVNEVDLTDKYEEKVCIKCNKCLPISCFSIYKIKNITSTRNVCLSCDSNMRKKSYSIWLGNNPEYHKEYYKNNREYFIGHVKQWKKNNPDKVKEQKARYYAKKKLEKLTFK
ncbi:hypothetical protein CMT52_08795 [Elizabethkingia anophelis]|nr:hypothetical protein [Elizabethkingia anophelis]